ncbi:hypothetical protein [Agrobacterium pusense]|uniref:hypothetical protein n=1 Tax=Agrobacterium pusense TaxID=648995 RepID=UPI000D3B3126|nr:hypothetical protein [Agrobacterium pusense]PTV70240.1 hypothetical protein DBL06_25590 [Agrobacterium pusense]
MTLTLEQYQTAIDGHLTIFDRVTVFDRHHRALVQHIRDARETMTAARDLRGVVEWAEHLRRAYDPAFSAKQADRARSFLEERPDRPFEGVVDLEIPADSMFRSTFTR